MLKITIIAVGKNKDRWLSNGCAHYEKLLSRFASVEWKLLPLSPITGSGSPKEIIREEGIRILKQLSRGTVIALSDKGVSNNSESFARLLESLQTSSRGSVTIVIGGAYGLSEEILNRADMALSLSPLTMSHQLVRLVLLEQLYRGFSILHGTNYHK